LAGNKRQALHARFLISTYTKETGNERKRKWKRNAKTGNEAGNASANWKQAGNENLANMETKGIKKTSLVSHAEANRKRSLAAKEQPRSEGGARLAEKQVVVQHEPPPDQAPKLAKTETYKGRAARAKQANVSTATQARVEALANNRPDLLEKVASGELAVRKTMPSAQGGKCGK
jgi:hypothetical protein